MALAPPTPKRFVVKMNGNVFMYFDERKLADGYVAMQRDKKKAGRGSEPAAAAMATWSVEDLGEKF